MLFAKWQQLTNIWRESTKKACTGNIANRKQLLRYEYKVVNTEANVDKTSDLLYRKNKSGDKMVSSFIQDTAEFTVLLSQREIHRPHFSNTI